MEAVFPRTVSSIWTIRPSGSWTKRCSKTELLPDVVTVEVIWPKESRVMVVMSETRACFEITPLAGS